MFFEPMVIEGVLVSSGRVMRPDEVNDSLAERPALQRRVSGWYLCGDVDERMFYALAAARGECTMQMTVLTGGAAGNYGLFAQQVGTLQHRFVLPLFEPSVAGLLESLQDAPVQLSLGRNDTEEALLIRQKLLVQGITQVQTLMQSLEDVDAAAVVANGQHVLESAMRIDSMKRFPGLPEVTDVCVSFVIPEAVFTVVDQFARTVSAASFH
ncbi:hypothetical protein OKW43_005801 [Paraburkholderia sp. WC7.3g]|uniref:Uncharacterized protein n=1 Tax=Paraburkholderia podalyriae TaxID=1938811 RepID=A0ABR7Q1T3_9BURK|nr:hypothetical protein [Paraburkholderia podalyriae]MBC8752507.1 hypothetical protein [Paraburkholderia podalyriae]